MDVTWTLASCAYVAASAGAIINFSANIVSSKQGIGRLAGLPRGGARHRTSLNRENNGGAVRRHALRVRHHVCAQAQRRDSRLPSCRPLLSLFGVVTRGGGAQRALRAIWGNAASNCSSAPTSSSRDACCMSGAESAIIMRV